MNLTDFNSTAKHIVVSVILALGLFTVVASQSANSEEVNSAQESIILKQELLIKQMETSYSDAKAILSKAQIDFEAGNLSTEEIFFITMKFYEIEGELLKAKLNYAQELGVEHCEVGVDTNIVAKN